MIEFHLDSRSGVPAYLQLVQQVRQAIRLGILRPGDQLPTAKEVVASLTINPNTVLHAYRQLDLRSRFAPPSSGSATARLGRSATARSRYPRDP
jgi:GntR family transcriptional regulator